MKQKIVTALIALLLSAGGATAAGVDDGVAAMHRKDYTEALSIFRPLAEQGNPTALYYLGILYHNGRGVPKDEIEGDRLIRLAATRGGAKAQDFLGGQYEVGKDVKQDYAEALNWYRLAAKQGYLAAQVSIGRMYENGIGVSKNYGEATKWYRLAANHGHFSAAHNLAYLFHVGEGVPKNYAEAFKFARLAVSNAANGEPRDAGMAGFLGSMLGGMYLRGEGVKKDIVRAYMWLSINAARSNGEAGSVYLRDTVEEQMTQKQIALGQEMALKCQESNFKNCF